MPNQISYERPSPAEIIHVHTVSWNEAAMMPWFLEHYSQFATRIFVHDNDSSDATRDIVEDCKIAEICPMHTGGLLRDDWHAYRKNTAWKGSAADWVIAVDVDELLVAEGCSLPEALRRYYESGQAVPPTCAHQMVAPALPIYRPGKQLYHDVRMGSLDESHAKPCVFDARRVCDINYDAGAHRCKPVFKSPMSVATFPGPPLHLLHFKYALGLEQVLKRHSQLAARLSPQNRRAGWGHHYSNLQTTIDGYQRALAGAQLLAFLPKS